MSAPVSPHGFETVRGRGYRPDDVDRRIEELSVDRDACWERAARLTVLANEMDAELAQLQEYVAQLPPQTYESLGEPARLILTTAQSEAERLWAEAQVAAEQIREEAMGHADQIRDAADAAARELRAEAEEWARRAEEAARAEAADVAAAAASDAEQWRDEAAAVLTDTRHRADQMRRDQEKRQAEEWEAAGRELAGLEAETDRLVAEREAHGHAVLAEPRRKHAEAEEAARHSDEDAADRATAIVARARVEAERIERGTARVLREHEEERAEVQAHMNHVRNSLAALTGKDPEDLEDEPEAEAGAAAEVEAAAEGREPEGRPAEALIPGDRHSDDRGPHDRGPHDRHTDDRQSEGRIPGDRHPDGHIPGDRNPDDRNSGDRNPDGCDPDNEDTLETELPRLDDRTEG
ncbi:cellulose-binding protein [Streptomyces sp. NPDC101227]|uniref:cellulose-binding protein n=1 Tax=Streptomyces sp. NPDC101227 TaxID=3366136 RepID=UPI0037FDFB83